MSFYLFSTILLKDPNNHKVMDNIRKANFDFTPVDPMSTPVSDSGNHSNNLLLFLDTHPSLLL